MSCTSTSPALEAEILEAMRAGLSWRKASAKFGVGMGVITRLGGLLKLDKSTGPEPEPEPVDPIQEQMDRMTKRRDLRQEADLLKSIAGERSFRTFLESLMREVAPRFSALPPLRRPNPDPDASKETLLLVWSDWHAFEEVSAVRTMGFNEFNGPILCERIRRLVLGHLTVKDLLERSGGFSFPEAVVALNGDFISGTIHELERHSDATSVIHATYATGLLLAAALRDLAPHFDRIRIRCTSGNHGRLPDARRMQQKDPTRNWDTAVYLYAKTALSDVPNLEWSIPDSYFDLYTIEGFRFLQTHGHEIKSWNSIPYYGIDRFGRNTNDLFSARQEHIDYFILSHFHSQAAVPTSSGETFINGSIIGGNEFSIGALGKSDKPKQWMLQVHNEHGVGGRWPIFASGPKRVAPYPLPDWPKAS